MRVQGCTLPLPVSYNMMHTLDFPTRFQNGHFSAIDNSFVDNSRMQSSEIFPLSNALSDHEAQCIMLNKFFPETKVKNDKHKNKYKARLIMSETICYFQEQLLQESWGVKTVHRPVAVDLRVSYVTVRKMFPVAVSSLKMIV